MDQSLFLMELSVMMANLDADSSLRKYLQKIWRIPQLNEAEERTLAVRWRSCGDRLALDKLVQSHLRLVVSIAARYRGYGLPTADLVSEGSIGLMRAAKKFDPDHGARLSTYAGWWIKASMHIYILRSWSLVSVATTTTQRKLFFRLRSLKAQIGIVDHGDMAPEHVARIAAELDVPPADVVAMNRRIAGADLSLNTLLEAVEDQSEWQDLLADESENQESDLSHRQSDELHHRLLSEALAGLGARERRIFVERQLSEEPRTLDELAGVFGISPERIRQIELKALAKVAKTVKARARPGASRLAERAERYGHFHGEVMSGVDHVSKTRPPASFGQGGFGCSEHLARSQIAQPNYVDSRHASLCHPPADCG